ncbi:MAG: DUF6512 family protein [Candidatus Dojkabacteria bacterium]|nr:MAG: DUF6512 family protein [Candidatus Dojkabacteria bacterium]
MNQIAIVELIGIPIIFILGSFFHFLYKYGGKRPWMAIFSPVNESIWEHLKIAFYPALIFAIFQYILLNQSTLKFFSSEIIGIYVMILFILVAEWIYPRILGKNVLVLDLAVFLIAIILGQLTSYFLYINTNFELPMWVILLVIFGQSIIFGILSFKPLRLPLFRDSVDGKYGIK